MTCRELMTSDPASCLPDDPAVTAAMLMKKHNIGSVPVVSSRSEMGLVGIVTDRDLTIRLVAEQRDYYRTTVGDVMSTDLAACRASDDSEEVVQAMAKRQIRRVPVVDSRNRLVGIISQADLAGSAKPREVGKLVEEISAPSSEHDKSAAFPSGMLMVVGGLGLGAGIAYLLDPKWASETARHVVDKIRSTAGWNQG